LFLPVGETSNVLDFREVGFECQCHPRHGKGYLLNIGPRERLDFVYPIDVLASGVKTIEAFLVRYKKIDHHTGGKADGETEDVDERVERVLTDVSEGDRKIVADHKRWCQ
jgi:hypothetical protein